MRVLTACLFTAMTAASAVAQFEILDAKTTASLRGIDALSAQVAWASGSGGTILLTTDGGVNWKRCEVPPGGERLDFRGVQGFDAMTAVIMASGTGPLAAVYRTVDGCASWKLTFANPDARGFFDNLHKVTNKQIYMLGDQVDGKFSMFYSPDQGASWFIAEDPGLEADKGDGGFAASNSGMISIGSTLYFGTGGAAVAHVYNTYGKCAAGAPKDAPCPLAWKKTDVPMAAGTAAAGIFSVGGTTKASTGGRTTASMAGVMTPLLVSVGGDYTKADEIAGTAAMSADGVKWFAATTMPHGFRSAVVFNSTAQRWIAVGPNGTDVSKDDGKNWTPLRPAEGDDPKADTGWNAISLPFVVGGRGKIGKLRAGVLSK